MDGQQLAAQSVAPAPVLPTQAPPSVSPPKYTDDRLLIDALRRGEEPAFLWLVNRYHGSLLRVARTYVADSSAAEEVVQETWLGVLEGIHRFEGRSSLKTWVFRILTNKAKTRGVRESRHITFSEYERAQDEEDEPAVDPAQFQASGFWTDHWAVEPRPWDDATPERLALSKESGALLEDAIEQLPARMRQVLIMRDVEGVDSKEICELLGLSEANQRVLLHRARARIRRLLETYMEGETRGS